ncbi:putative ribose/galactose/methyl galactoside import ATP-binding protein 2 [Betaproteobacteria bacterium]|nr:putative ribose/galactose/methyl galactoside import ATP-binding protein 2 [Betaproteobacteria bacterium]
MDTVPLLELRGIEKLFPGVKALSNMSFSVKPGSVHVLCGENGAGKSTLCKIINGIHQPDRGEILVNGQSVVMRDPLDARAHRIAMIFQELNFIPELTVEQNLFLGREPVNRFGKVDWKSVRWQTAALLAQEGLPYKPDTQLKELSVSDIQMLEIIKAISYEANILIMDEPTSAISTKEVDMLFRKIAELKAKGAGIIYISHKMDEIFRIADEISVLRDGCLIDTRPAKELDIDTVIRLMVGRQMESVFPEKQDLPPGPVALEVDKLTQGRAFRDVCLTLRQGEIVGLAGLMGAGRTEVVRALFGLDPYTSGTIRLKGEEVAIRDVQDSIGHGMVMVSEDRKRFGIIPVRDCQENMSLSSLKTVMGPWGIKHREERERNAAMSRRLNVKTPSLETLISSLSGGNQQKIVLAKWLLCSPEVLLLDEPTRGIDVGAKFEIYKLITELAQEGKAVLMISSEMEELIGVCDRIYVMAKGRITGELARRNFSQENIMKLALIG